MPKTLRLYLKYHISTFSSMYPQQTNATKQQSTLIVLWHIHLMQLASCYNMSFVVTQILLQQTYTCGWNTSSTTFLRLQHASVATCLLLNHVSSATHLFFCNTSLLLWDASIATHLCYDTPLMQHTSYCNISLLWHTFIATHILLQPTSCYSLLLQHGSYWNLLL